MVFKNLLSKSKDIDILGNIPDGILVVDSDGLVEKANERASELFKWSGSLLSKANVDDLIEGGFDIIKQTSANKQSAVGKVLAENSENAYFEITSKSIQDKFIVSFRDVTQSYKTVTNLMIEQKSSQKSNNDKNNFIVKLSGEFQSPLRLIAGFSQSMIDGLGGEMTEKQDKYIKIINKNSLDALYFMNKIIELAKTESNLFEYDTQKFDVVNTAQIVEKEFEPQVEGKKLGWDFEFNVAKKSIVSDEGAIKVILTNILEVSLGMTDIGSISFKVFDPDNKILVSRGFEVSEEESYEKEYLMMSISDTGAGYSQSELETLFEPYMQLEKPNRKNITRSIILASTRNLVKHLKGEIWVESVPMRSTTYNIIIPIAR